MTKLKEIYALKVITANIFCLKKKILPFNEDHLPCLEHAYTLCAPKDAVFLRNGFYL